MNYTDTYSIYLYPYSYKIINTIIYGSYKHFWIPLKLIFFTSSSWATITPQFNTHNSSANTKKHPNNEY